MVGDIFAKYLYTRQEKRKDNLVAKFYKFCPAKIQ